MLEKVRNERKAREIMQAISDAMHESNTIEGSADENNEAMRVLTTIGIDIKKVFGVSVRRPSEEETNRNPYEIQIYFGFNGEFVYLNNYNNHSGGLYFTNAKSEIVNYFDLVKPLETENALKRLEFFTPGIMKDLHFLFNFDFCKPYEVRKICGAYTVGQIKKALGNAADGAKVICLTTSDRYSVNDNRVVEISDKYCGGFNAEIDTRWTNSGVDHFYRKSDFNDARKLETAEAIIIAQKFEDLSQKPHSVGSSYDYKNKNLLGDRFERYNVKNVSRTHYGHNARGSYISELSIKTRTHKGETIRLSPSHKYEPETTQELNEIIDKSGYLLQGVRFERQEKADKIRKEKKKAAADIFDVSEKTATIKALIEAKKQKIIVELQNARTAKDYDEISDKLDMWRTDSLAELVRLFEEFNKAANNKTFVSVEDIESRYNRMLQNI